MERNKDYLERCGWLFASVSCTSIAMMVVAGCVPKAEVSTGRRVVEWSDQQTSYIKHQIAVLPYGNGDAQLGRLEVPEMGASGPESFWVDDNEQIHICDTVNEKVKTLSETGALVYQTPLGFAGNDLAVDSNGDMFVLDRTRQVVEQLSRSGEKRGTLQLDRNHLDTAFNLRVVHDRVLLASVMQDEAVLGEMHNGRMALRTNLRDARFNVGMLGSAARRFRTLRNEARQAEIDVLDEDEEVVDRLLMPMERVASVVFLGKDELGHSYYQLERSESDHGVSLSVYCLDEDGIIDSAIENIPNDYTMWTAKLLQLASNGDIYQMLPTETGVELNVWERQ